MLLRSIPHMVSFIVRRLLLCKEEVGLVPEAATSSKYELLGHIVGKLGPAPLGCLTTQLGSVGVFNKVKVLVRSWGLRARPFYFPVISPRTEVLPLYLPTLQQVWTSFSSKIPVHFFVGFVLDAHHLLKPGLVSSTNNFNPHPLKNSVYHY